MSAELTTRVQELIDSTINPAVAGPGGFGQLIHVKDNKGYPPVGGGWAGWGGAGTTREAGSAPLVQGGAPRARPRRGPDPIRHPREVAPSRAARLAGREAGGIRERAIPIPSRPRARGS